MMNPEIKIKKEDLVCAFHSDVECNLQDMKKKLDILLYIAILNALFTGAHLIFKLPLLF